MEEGKIATAWAQFATQRSPSMYIRMRVLPWSNTFVSKAGLINFSPLVNQPVAFTSAIERSGIWKEDSNGLGTVWRDSKKSINVYKNACYLE
jgi:hypothetical protein